MYPNGTAVTVDLEFRPISITLSDREEPRTMALVIGNPVTVQVAKFTIWIELLEFLRIIFGAGRRPEGNDQEPRNA